VHRAAAEFPAARCRAVSGLLLLAALSSRAVAQNAPPANPADTVPSVKQSFTVQTGARHVTVGDSAVREQAGTYSYSWQRGRWALSLDGSSLQYTAARTPLNGWGSTNARLDVMLRPGDTLSFYGRSGTQPGALDSAQVAALGIAGGALVDLQSTSLGAPGMFGGRASFAFPVGDFVWSLRGSLESEAKPSAARPVTWHGTTWAVGSTLYAHVGRGEWSAVVDLTQSSADSLNGKNLFAGGGGVNVRSELHFPVSNPADSAGDDWDLYGAAWWSTPMNATRADQPNRLIPLGNTMGVSGSFSVPVGDGSFGPTLQFERTSANAAATQGSTAIRTSSSAWAATVLLDASIPTGRWLEWQPQLGWTTGDATTSYGSTTTRNTVVKRRGRTVTTSANGGTSDAIAGWWFQLGVTAHF
jgi:hypothetical protein